MTIHEITIVTEDDARAEVLRWIRDEFAFYADGKWEDQREKLDAAMAVYGMKPGSFWHNQITQYWSRLRIFNTDHGESDEQENGLRTYRARQLFAKSATTLIDAIASSVRQYGPLPDAGHSSGGVYYLGEPVTHE